MKLLIALLLLTMFVNAEEKDYLKESKQLIEQLGSNKYKERRDAKSALKKVESLKELEATLLALFLSKDSEDPEIRMSISEIIPHVIKEYHMNAELGISLASGELRQEHIAEKQIKGIDKKEGDFPVFLIGTIDEDSKYYKAGLRDLQVITKINGNYLSDIPLIDFNQYLPLELFLWTKGKFHTLTFDLFDAKDLDENIGKVSVKKVTISLSYYGDKDKEYNMTEYNKAYKIVYELWNNKAKESKK